jgi:hypothetical protein
MSDDQIRNASIAQVAVLGDVGLEHSESIETQITDDLGLDFIF